MLQPWCLCTRQEGLLRFQAFVASGFLCKRRGPRRAVAQSLLLAVQVLTAVHMAQAMVGTACMAAPACMAAAAMA